MGRSCDEQTTSEMRHDWLTDRWVIVATQRNDRPVEFVRRPAEIVPDAVCPFCYGQEDETPEPVACYYPNLKGGCADHSRWQVRVVPNKFPAVQSGALRGSATNSNYISLELEKELGEASSSLWAGSVDADDAMEARLAHEPCAEGLRDAPRNDEALQTDMRHSSQVLQSVNLFRKRDLTGGHEVIIEAPDHVQSITQLDPPSTKLVFQAYRDRLNHWLVDRELAYAVVFKNVGHDAGASLVHSHSQVIATDILPTEVARVARRMELYHEQEGACLLCRTIADEQDQKVRIVEETSDYIAFCPFASRLPSLVTIAPKYHGSQFELLDDDGLGQLSWLTHRLVRRLEHCHPESAYNYVIYTAPRCQQGTPWFHWRIELFPRLSTLAGFEWGSECYINPLTPEAAAMALRVAGV